MILLTAVNNDQKGSFIGTSIFFFLKHKSILPPPLPSLKPDEKKKKKDYTQVKE